MGIRLLLALAILLGCGLSVAHAENKPWAAGVSAEDQKRALTLYQEGNGYFELDQYARAFATFEKAVGFWDHPSIRYNAAVSLIHLDRPVEAFEYLTSALRFGAAPFAAEIYKEAKNYEKLLLNQLGEIEVACNEPGAQVTLDGQPLFVGPGVVTKRVRAGLHQIVAVKPPLLTESHGVRVEQRESASLTITMKRPEVARRQERRWAGWKPWLVGGAGLVIAAAGGGLLYSASQTMDRYVAGVEAHWNAQNMPMSMPTEESLKLPEATADLEDTAKRREVLAYSAFAVGGAVIVTGVVLVIMNTPRMVSAASIAPQVGSDRAGVVVTVPW